MNWRRMLYRFWLVLSGTWIVAVGVVAVVIWSNDRPTELGEHVLFSILIAAGPPIIAAVVGRLFFGAFSGLEED